MHHRGDDPAPLLALLQSRSTGDCPYGLLCCTFRHYHRFEALYGHERAEELIAAGRHTLEQRVPQGTTILRTGPAELALVLPLCTGHDAELMALAQQLNHQCTIVHRPAGPPLLLTMAIGAATTETRPGSSAAELLSRARLAMHAAQSRAGHQVVIATPTLQLQADTLYRQEAELVLALERQQLTAYLQPIVNLRTRQTIGFECLARWMRSDGNVIAPRHFLAQANDAGLTAAVDLQVLEASLRAAQPLAEALSPGQTLLLSANLSAQLVDSERCQRRLLDLIAQHPLPQGVALQLELVEESLNEADPGLEDLLQHLSDRDVQIAIDDFGTGYSSLSRLHNLAIDAIKVDRSFVQRINAPGKPSNHLLDMLVAIGSDLKIMLTAEGVETEQQRQWLLDHGIELAQGYLFSAPLSVTDAINHLRDQMRDQNRPAP
ncbi:MAG: hypothetical protein RLZZ336_1818 [Cyanobacteriota bacterium]